MQARRIPRMIRENLNVARNGEDEKNTKIINLISSHQADNVSILLAFGIC